MVGDADLMASFFIRGGEPDEAVFYLDGLPLSNPFHLGGFTSVFNPELVREVSFFAGGAPASYRTSLSGVVDVTYLAGGERQEAVTDLSANTAKLAVAGPTPIEGLSLMLSARRSYFELYFALLKDLRVVGQRFVAPDLGEYEAKATYRAGRHRFDFAILQATDGPNFVGSADDGALIPFEGSLRTSNDLLANRLSWQYTPSGPWTVSAMLGWVLDRFGTERRGAAVAGTSSLLSSADTRLNELTGRLDLDWKTHRENHLRLGLDLSGWSQQFSGRVEDTRAVPRWIATPLADYHRPTLDIRPELRGVDLGLYAEDEWTDLLPGLTPRAGLRLDLAQRGEALVSPRVGVSYRLFEPTVLKAAWGIYSSRSRSPLELDPVYGNPDLGPQRAIHITSSASSNCCPPRPCCASRATTRTCAT